jgi:hypothetical protein
MTGPALARCDHRRTNATRHGSRQVPTIRTRCIPAKPVHRSAVAPEPPHDVEEDQPESAHPYPRPQSRPTRSATYATPTNASLPDYSRPAATSSSPLTPTGAGASDSAHFHVPSKHLPASRRFGLPPPSTDHFPVRDDRYCRMATRSQTRFDDQATAQALPAKHLHAMPIRHCDRLRWTIPAVSYTSALRDSVPSAMRIWDVAAGGLPRAALCLAGVDTAGRFPYALSASICRRRACAGLTPDQSCRGTRCILDPTCPHGRLPCWRFSPYGPVAVATASPA